MKFLQKKVRILGKAIPVSVILLLVVTVVAVGAFLLSFQFNTSISAGTVVTGNLSSLNCEITAGLGSVNECTQAGGDISIILVAVDNDTEVKITASWQAGGTPDLDTATAHFEAPSPLPSAVGALQCKMANGATPSQDCEGTVTLAGIPMYVDIDFDLSNIVPDEVVEDLDFILSFSD